MELCYQRNQVALYLLHQEPEKKLYHQQQKVLLREPALLSVCPREAGGKAMEIPKGVATALDPPAAHPVVKRTVKANPRSPCSVQRKDM